MKEWKSLICMNLVLCMVLGMFSPVAVYAEETAPQEIAVEGEETAVIEETSGEETVDTETETVELQSNNIAASGACGVNLTWTLDEEGTLTISGNGAMYDFDSSNQPWYDCRSSIKKLVVEIGVTSVGSYAFAYCDALIEASLPDGLNGIDDKAFYNCDGLKEIFIPGTVVWSSSQEGRYAFESCDKLEKVVFGEGIRLIPYDMFASCDALTTVEFPKSLETVSSWAFENCTALKTISIPNNVEEIDSEAFMGCSALETITFGSKVATISNSAFQDCTALTSLDLPNSLRTIGQEAFRGCTSLQEISIGSGITTIEYAAFGSCSSLATVTIDNYQTSVAVNADAFPAAATISYKPISDDAVMGTWNVGKSNETDVIATLYATGRMVISGNGAMADFEDGLLADVSENLGSKNINSIVIQEGVTSVGDYAFWGGSNVTSISFPESLTAIGYGAFNNCYNLTTVDIGSNIRVIERKAFANCDGLTTININTSQCVVDVGTDSFPEETTVTWLPGDDNTVANVWEIGTYDETDVTATLYTSGRLVITGVGSIGKAPWSKRITKVEIGEGITQIGSGIFSKCTALTEVSTPSTLTSINASAFEGCTALTTISTLENVTNIENNAFQNCTALTSLATLERITRIGNYAFDGCTALRKLSTLENVTFVGNYAFRNCSNLSDIDLNSAQQIGKYAFQKAGIETAYIYEVVEIGTYAFSNCPNLIELAVGVNLEDVGTQAFANCPNLSTIFWEAAEVDGIGKESNLFLNSGKDRQGIKLFAYTEKIPAYLFYTSSENAGKEPNLTAIRTGKKHGSPTEIGAFAFYRAVNLSSIETLYNIETIGDGAFNTCSALKSIELGDDLKTLGNKAFFRSGLISLAAGGNLTEIGESSFAECAEGFYLEGYSGSTLEQYAQANGITFVPFTTSGSDGSIQWSFDEASGELTITGTGAITTTPWSHLANQVKDLSLGEGITEITSDIFVDYDLSTVVFPATLTTLSASAFDELEEVYFLGAMPVISEPAGSTKLLFDSVYYLSGAAGWNNCTWEEDYDCGKIAPFSNKQGTMTILEETNYYRKESSVSSNVGVLVPLESYSEDAQIRYYEYASDANLIGWSNGSTVYKPTDSAALVDGSVLTAQWKVKMFTIDGNSYPVNKETTGSGWQYSDNILTLNGYSGGSIALPDGVWLYAEGNNTINGSIVSAENDLDFMTNKALVMQILSGHTTVTNIGVASDNNTLLLDSDFIQIMVEESAELDLHSCDFIASPADRITLVCDGTARLTSDSTCALNGKGKNRVYLIGSGSITVQASEYAIAKGITPQFGYGYDIYLEPDAIDSASKYVAGSYLRREARKWSILLDANGGIWSDIEDSQRIAQQGEDSAIGLKKYKDLLTRSGYVLIGWSDEDNTIDFTVNGAVTDKYENITLYAVWQKDALQVDGKTLPITKNASGNGWSFAPAKSNQPAILSILSDYSGKPIAYTHDLTVNIEGDVEIVGTTGACAIDVMGNLNLNIAEGDVKIVGGNGEHAIHATGDIELQNDGCTSIEGGNGGHGVYGYNVYFSNNGVLTVVGGLRASAICADNGVHLGAVNGVINLLAGQNVSNAVRGSGFGYSGKLRFYCGQNAGSLTRKSAFRYAGSYPYARIQPKLVVITLDANGGSIGGSTIATLSLLQADDNTFTMKNSAQPVRNGYAFNGWNTAADGSGESYTAGQIYTATEDAEIQLFAQWEEVGTLSGSFNQNEDSLAIAIPNVLTKDANVMVACYDKQGQMLDMAFGTQKETMWIFEIGNDQGAYAWSVFFTDDDTHAPKQVNLPLSISK